MVRPRFRFGFCVGAAVLLLASACGSRQPDALPTAQSTAAPAVTTTPVESGDATATTPSVVPEPTTVSAETDHSRLTAADGRGAPNTAFTPILIDQFGYLSASSKVAILVARDGYSPDELQVIDLSDNSSVYAGAAVAWRDGQVDPQSGDRGWRFDFSSVTEPGQYQIQDVASGETSGPFVISDGVYDDLLTTSLRVFYYNRGNIVHETAHAGRWAGAAVATGNQQDRAAQSIDDPNAARQDLSGGWFDAGDTNKYVTFATGPVHQLLAAYETAPDLFGDNTDIPESGNGTPDLLDEVRVELEWLTRMQQNDGGVLTKVGYSGYDGATADPSVDDRPRFYEEACSSASIAAAGMLAHGAVSFETIDEEFASDLRLRAEQAWDWFESNPWRDDCDPQVINAGDADVSIEDQRALRFVAAVYLYAATGSEEYDQAVRDGLDRRALFPDDAFGRYHPERAEAVEFYLNLPNGDPDVVSSMKELVADLSRNWGVHGFDDGAGLYRSYMPDAQYHWGSNMVMANSGNGSLALARLGVDPKPNIVRASAHLNTLNGVNPLGLVYLSNMNDQGAERSITELYHFWFGDGTDYDTAWSSSIGPAPGYLVGGPNASYSGSNPNVQRQPIAKAYDDFNSHPGDERPWELSEPAIYYQSAYVRLLSGVMAATSG